MLTAPAPGDRWRPRGVDRLLKRDLAEAGVPIAWRSVWPIIRAMDGTVMQCVGMAGGARDDLRLDCEWLGFKVVPAFAPPARMLQGAAWDEMSQDQVSDE